LFYCTETGLNARLTVWLQQVRLRYGECQTDWVRRTVVYMTGSADRSVVDTCVDFLTDPNAGRLEWSAVHRYVEDVAVGRSLFHLPNDVRQLYPVQPPRRHSCRRIFWRSKILCNSAIMTLVVIVVVVVVVTITIVIITAAHWYPGSQANNGIGRHRSQTLAESYITISASLGDAAEHSAARKSSKYSSLPTSHIFQPVALETLGPLHSTGISFFSISGADWQMYQKTGVKLYAPLSTTFTGGPACSVQGYLFGPHRIGVASLQLTMF